MPGIQGSFTSAVSGTSVTLPAQNLTIIGAGVYGATTGGYLTINLDAGQTANLLFSVPVGVTTTDVPTTQGNGPLRNGIWPFTLKVALTLNYSGTGLSSGTFVFYFGSPFPGSPQLITYRSIVQSYTTGALAGAFSFPGGPVKLNAVAHVFGVNTAQTILQDRISFNTGAGFSITLSFSMSDDINLIPIDAVAAQSLTVTNTLTGTGVGTGYVAIYYTI